MKKAFSLIMAIFFVVMLGIVGTLTLRIIAGGSKDSADLYLYEQAKLLAISGTEYAILRIQENDFKTNCDNIFTLYYPNNKKPIFTITVDVMYIGANLPNECKKWIDSGITQDKDGQELKSADGKLKTSIQAVILDTSVISEPSITQEQISIKRTTIQKP
ncbi:hypothetical protein [Campylobacter fetus]|uniref:hypothetical protein n=1 Tax=Campylobacter fetus TaxID=196 RepID=UPI000FCC9662|nr:hypothetical protein [Campylobacter fetus]QQF51851.1 hypothetical protein HHI31_03010 [Campylobacter fetus subsp. venerealis]RUT51421.1 hypothetical protein BWK67_02570 [Campylobacter fetus]RUT52151.1 hypothetical protein BWK51_02575 [Campylobacter fetus]